METVIRLRLPSLFRSRSLYPVRNRAGPFNILFYIAATLRRKKYIVQLETRIARSTFHPSASPLTASPLGSIDRTGGRLVQDFQVQLIGTSPHSLRHMAASAAHYRTLGFGDLFLLLFREFFSHQFILLCTSPKRTTMKYETILAFHFAQSWLRLPTRALPSGSQIEAMNFASAPKWKAHL